ncbi:MAG TPA: hypothetical protein DD979_05970 [Gammaproteobacteria bacterium]|jgi:signal transduction histidine kinase|nr:hypothetical protein [Gammaproteobacteria bacterium]
MAWGIASTTKRRANRLPFTYIRQWLVQALFIVFAVLLSIFAVSWVLEKSLIREALELEADAFVEAYTQDPEFPLPRTRNLVGYLAEQGEGVAHIPPDLQVLPPGLHNAVAFTGREERLPVFVRDFSGHRLYLIFEGANIDRLVGIYGLLPLAVLLIALYLSAWLAYRFTARAVSPILRIARNLRESALESAGLDLPHEQLTGDARELAAAIEDYTRRHDALIARERQFSADVSHELRTPMTIIDGAAQFLAAEDGLSDKGSQRVHMIRRACRDVNELISAFLFLSRETASVEKRERANVADVIQGEVEKLTPLLDASAVSFQVDIQAAFYTETPKKALEIILGNVLRNAAKYTAEGEIRIISSSDSIMVEDTGIGIPETLLPSLFERHVRGRGLQQAGEGIGLAIVKRLCDQFDWTIDVQNRDVAGVRVTLRQSSSLPTE